MDGLCKPIDFVVAVDNSSLRWCSLHICHLCFWDVLATAYKKQSSFTMRALVYSLHISLLAWDNDDREIRLQWKIVSLF